MCTVIDWFLVEHNQKTDNPVRKQTYQCIILNNEFNGRHKHVWI